ncbi:helix-turn-helix domain-containing protein [Shewanella sp. SP2S2-6]|uniref:helix-turn-helix transcriptional regulator n=1 Tax=Shewanella sp. SP2S2-6 TaxID=3063540 RepID=UPI002891E9F0|nr:helix-turn-helix domain-containing protein [Shewanella sp. SP2S2-6]MDT3296746.1 helix-turn-helix domain-containing protein [Shewanella sp. SP2S2-6]
MNKRSNHLVRCAVLGNFEHFIRENNGNPVALLREVGLTSAGIKNPDSYISSLTVSRLFTLCSKKLAMPLFGLQLCLADDSSPIGVLAISLALQPDIESMIEFAKEHYYLQNNNLFFDTKQEQDRFYIIFNNILESKVKVDLVQLNLFQVQGAYDFFKVRCPPIGSGLYAHSTFVLDESLRPSWAEHIKFGSSFNGISFPVRHLQLKPSVDERDLYKLSEQVVDNLKLSYPDNLISMSQHIIMQNLSAGESSIAQLANALGMTVRNLQNKFKELDVSYNQLLKDCRLQQACSLLSDPSISILDISLSLGYSDTSVFSRQFKRWTGLTPLEWRGEFTPLGN